MRYGAFPYALQCVPLCVMVRFFMRYSALRSLIRYSALRCVTICVTVRSLMRYGAFPYALGCVPLCITVRSLMRYINAGV